SRPLSPDWNLGRTHCRLIISLGPFAVEVEGVKLQTFDELPLGFRLKCRQTRIAQLLVDFPICLGDGVEQTLIESQYFLGIGHQEPRGCDNRRLRFLTPSSRPSS